MDKQQAKELSAIVGRNYEEVAAEFSGSRRRPLWPALAELAGSVPAGASVLDVGCGNGRLRQAWTGKGVRYVGVEPSRRLLELAQASEAWRLPEQTFLAGGISRLGQLGLGQFDQVYCIAVLHHLPSWESRREAVTALLDRVKPGGRLVVSVWSMWQNSKLWRLVFKNAIRKMLGLNRLAFGDIVFAGFGQPSRRYYHMFTKGGFARLMRTPAADQERLIFDGKNYYAVLRKKIGGQDLSGNA